MELSDWAEVEMTNLAQVYRGLANKARIAALVAISSDTPITEVAEFFGMKRSSLQDHIDKLVEAELIYRPEEESKTYELTPLGEYFITRISLDHENIPRVFEIIKETEERLDKETEEKKVKAKEMEIPIDEKQLNRRLHTQKWKMNWEDIKDVLSEEVREEGS